MGCAARSKGSGTASHGTSVESISQIPNYAPPRVLSGGISHLNIYMIGDSSTGAVGPGSAVYKNDKRMSYIHISKAIICTM